MNNLILCLITIRAAQHLGHAARLAGGWIATSDICRMAVEDVTEQPLLLGLLPSDWSEASPSARSHETMERIALRLESAAAGTGSETAADFAARIRTRLASQAVDQAAFASHVIGGAS